MPIRTVPLAAIDLALIREMIVREIREDRTLDFKQDLALTDSGKLDLLGDVVAMANSLGGTILYGAVEGDDSNAGRIVGVRPIAMEPDATTVTIDNVFRDGINDRIAGIEHRAIPADGGFLYVVRVPSSPRALHMITKASHRPRFTSAVPLPINQ